MIQRSRAFVASASLVLLCACSSSSDGGDAAGASGGSAGTGGGDAGMAGGAAGVGGMAAGTGGAAAGTGGAAAGTGGAAAGTGGAAAGAGGMPAGTGGVGTTCTADITAADGSNVGVMHFEVNTAGGVVLPQGSQAMGADGMTDVGLTATSNGASGTQQLIFDLIGPALAAGADYSTGTDLGLGAASTPNYLGFSITSGPSTSAFLADAGTVVHVSAFGPGPLPSYKLVTLTFENAHMTPSSLTPNTAMGSFSMSGTCSAAIQMK